MKKLGRKISRMSYMVIALAITLPLVSTGFTVRIQDCHCDEGESACSVEQKAPAAEENLPPCCQVEKPKPQKHDCHDECCVRELHFDGTDIVFYTTPKVLSSDITVNHREVSVIFEEPQVDIDYYPFHSRPPGLHSARLLLISIHQLRIASPATVLA